MPFTMKLLPPDHRMPDLVELELPFALDDEVGLVEVAIGGASVLAQSGYTFHVNGFGSSNWAVDVAYDFATIIEQVPHVLQALEATKPVRLDFYAQGTETSVYLGPAGESVEAVCSPLMSDLDPGAVSELLKLDELVKDLRNLLAVFVDGVRQLWPELGRAKAVAEMEALLGST